jgi:hypothetical protein
MSIAVREYTPKTHEMHSWQMELDMIESHLIDEENIVTKLQTFIDQLDEKAASARLLLEDGTVSVNQKKKANSILSKCEAERPKPARQLEAAKSRLKDLQTKKENFKVPALQEEQRMEKLLRNLAS